MEWPASILVAKPAIEKSHIRKTTMNKQTVITLAFEVDSKTLEDARSVILSLNSRRGGDSRELKKMAGDKGLPRLKKAEFDSLTEKEKEAVKLYSCYVAVKEAGKAFGHISQRVKDAAPASDKSKKTA